MEKLTVKSVIAAKEYDCFACEVKISNGDHYLYTRDTEENNWTVKRYCGKCAGKVGYKGLVKLRRERIKEDHRMIGEIH